MKNSNTMLSRAFTGITVVSLVFALNVSGALAGFWRTIDEVTSNGVLNPSEFLYGLGWDGSNFGVYGYGYGVGYGDFDAGYGVSSSSSSSSSTSGGGSGGGGSSSSSGGGSSSSSSSSSSSTSSSSSSTSSSSSSSGGVPSTNYTKRSYESEPKIATCGTSISNFTDIAGTTFEQYIIDLEKVSGLNGNGNGSAFNMNIQAGSTFQPARTATRSEYIKLVLRALCIDYSTMNTTLDDFSDTGVDTWQARVVNKAADLGWINTTNSTFRVNDSISRVEALKIIMQAGILDPLATPTVSSFTDVPVGSWESKYTQAALGYGIIAANATFRPADAILRGESAKLIMNTLY